MEIQNTENIISKRPNIIWLTVLTFGSAASMAGLIFFLLKAFGFAAILQWGKEYVYWPFLHAVFNPVFFGAVAVILILERLYPVNRNQKTFSVGFWHDSVWLVLGLLFEGAVVVFYARALKDFYDVHLSFLTVDAVMLLPGWLRLTFGILLTDFLAWFQHWLKHKVPWFWHIHAIHHSQREINLFTDFRFHFLEYIISRTIVVIPLLMFLVEPPKIALYVIFNTWFTRFYHANIKSNLGPLRYILVTPQSHRVHHSIERRHHDMNFGVLFSIWDRIFGTQYENYEEYPETGIEEEEFPLEMETSLLSLIVIPLKQLLYPFAAIGRRFRNKQ